jgi:hypothetical protein
MGGSPSPNSSRVSEIGINPTDAFVNAPPTSKFSSISHSPLERGSAVGSLAYKHRIVTASKGNFLKAPWVDSAGWGSPWRKSHKEELSCERG